MDEIFVTQITEGILSAVRVQKRPTCIMEHDGFLSTSALCRFDGTKLSNRVEEIVVFLAA